MYFRKAISSSLLTKIKCPLKTIILDGPSWKIVRVLYDRRKIIVNPTNHGLLLRLPFVNGIVHVLAKKKQTSKKKCRLLNFANICLIFAVELANLLSFREFSQI